MKKVVTIALLGTILSISSTTTELAHASDTTSHVAPATLAAQNPEDVLKNRIKFVNDKNWGAFLDTSVDADKPILNQFLQSDISRKNKDGVFAIQNAKVVGVKELSLDESSNYAALSKYIEKYGQAKVYYVAVDYKVDKESKYFLNGINYFLAITVPENGTWKVAEFSSAPVDTITSRKQGFGTTDENQMSQMVSNRHKGLFLNRSGKVVERNVGANESTTQELQSNVGATAINNSHTVPSYIRVWTYNGQNIWYYGTGGEHDVSFYYYLKNVLPNEWPKDSTTEGWKTGAECAKMYGWYYVYNPKHPESGYDVDDTTNDQVFVAGTELDVSTGAINAVGGQGMQRADGTLFVAFYLAGSYNSTGAAQGWVSQNGSNYLATNQGKSWTGILHYYYDQSNYNSPQGLNNQNMTMFTY
ncbi:SpoIID/LytB domain-containing protein [Tumebacillus sp. ITR2]|uniref:SpoIID/LytB domain-containing protein n=1 Tax=Tumebacillus amylolyticus TaxID=2801339 RepID=A0ABS1JGR1_9BACL|nr:SpoIID/LytB domain-containing protein [Tumebacillus amylolyticus]MBL0389194.1 SpoIID/LytB domain-containing protein [Tumebacillus amylolyticus]